MAHPFPLLHPRPPETTASPCPATILTCCAQRRALARPRPCQLAGEFPPLLPLLPPTEHRGDRPDCVLPYRVAPALDTRQEEKVLLDVRSQEVQVHDLRDPRPRHVAHAGQLRVVADVTPADEPVHPDRQRHQTRDAGDAADGNIGSQSSLFDPLPLVGERRDRSLADLVALQLGQRRDCREEERPRPGRR